ncbi:7-cyano-7-deazaguanine synthase [Acidithiobacillus sp. AMEEHan]|uniref:7-cyano-7-deazaguanine synthase n=1 Tax=Acidithiobacillus sp. AMEEHan TaxID=2994951 RepID=UPI0027E48831|nr:7-cyano-7-deazaguanine synthase [Acidithiobacillus sp. AMEEHan]
MIDQVQQLLPDLPAGERVLLLLSGGVESSTLLRLLRRGGLDPEPVFLDYAQRAATQEWQSVTAQCQQLGIAARRIPMRELGEALGKLRPHRFHVPMLYRNLIAISVAASVAGALGICHICMGISADDAAVDSGSRVEALAPLRNHLAALGHSLRLPLFELHKAEIVKLGQGLGVEWNLSYSCLLGRAQHCGACPQCLKRREAFRNAGLQAADVQYARDY